LNIPKGASRKIEPSDATPVNILFRKDGHIYDTTEGKYLGYISGNKEVKATLLPGIAKIYGVFQYKIEQINANTEKNSYAPGDTIKIFVNLKTSGKEVGNHVIYTEVVGTDGKIRDFYAQKIHVRQGKGVVEIPTAFNDEKGNWTVILKEAASGLTTKLNIKMAPLLSD